MGGGAERTRGTYAPRASSGTCDTRRAHATRRANARYTARTHAHLFAAAEFDALPVDGDESRADRQQSPITWGVTDGGLHARDTSAPRLRGRRVLLEHDAQSRLGERALKRGSGLPWDGGLRAQATPARLMDACEYGGESAPRARPRVLAPGALVPHTPPPIIRSAANAPFLHALARPTADMPPHDPAPAATAWRAPALPPSRRRRCARPRSAAQTQLSRGGRRVRSFFAPPSP